jgi:radical SAM protein with 4Fe4S-binding SPASM domain
LAFNPVIRSIKRGESGAISVSRNDVMAFARGFVQAHALADRLGMRLLSSFTFNFDESTSCACRSCVPMPQLNPDGSVSSCDMALYFDTKRELQSFLYGAWNQQQRLIEYDMDKIAHLKNRRIENLPKCQNCDIKSYCAGGCAGRIAYQTGNIYDTINEFCAATRYLANKIPLGRKLVAHSHP